MSEVTESSSVLYAVYRAYRGRKLLYVGSTCDLPRRIKEHERRRTWWPEVTRVTVKYHADRESAWAEEYAAIRKLRPVHNVAGSEARNPRVRAAIEAMLATEPERRVVPMEGR